MNLLSQILPGVRDFRTPFTVGVLWAISAVVLFRHLNPSLQAALSETASHYSGYASELPTAAQGTLVAMALYILGMILSYVGERIVALMAIVRPQTVVPIAIVISVFLFPLALITLTFIGTLSVMILFFLAIRKTRETALEVCIGMVADLKEIIEIAWLHAVDLVRFLSAGLSSERREREFFLKEDSARKVRTSAFIRQRLVSEIRDVDLVNSLGILGIGWDRELLDDGKFKVNGFVESPDPKLPGFEASKGSALPAEEVAALFDTARTWDDVARIAGPNRRLNEALRTFQRNLIATALESDSVAQRKLVQTYLSFKLASSDVDRRISDLRVQMKVNQPTLYDEYDKLKSEAEFRTAIAFPLYALVVALGYAAAPPFAALNRALISNWVGLQEFVNSSDGQWLQFLVTFLSEQPWIAWLVGLIPFMLCLSAGRAKQGESSRLLYAAIRQEAVVNADASLFLDDDISFHRNSVFNR